MKIGKNILKKSIVLSVLVMYLVVALVYISYLPRYNSSPIQPSAVSCPLHIRKEGGTSGSSSLFHRIFKTVIAGKSQAIAAIKVLATFFLFFFSGLTLFNLGSGKNRHIKSHLDFHRFSFPAICALRI